MKHSTLLGLWSFGELVTQVMQWFQNCQASRDDGMEMMRNPSRRQERVLRRRVRRSLGLRDYLDHGNDVLEALKQTGKTVTEEEYDELHDEVSFF